MDADLAMEAAIDDEDRPQAQEGQRLCRLCATITTHPNRVDIFTVDGRLQHKIETCLPIHVRKESQLPDMLCLACEKAIDAFYAFRKRSLETLSILEEKYKTIQTCFTSSGNKSKAAIDDKSTSTDNLHIEFTQFEEWKQKKLGQFHLDSDSVATTQRNEQTRREFQHAINKAETLLAENVVYMNKLVDYDSDTTTMDSEPTPMKQQQHDENTKTNIRNKLYFDDSVNDIISEIVERKSTKRKLDMLDAEMVQMHKPKMFKPSSGCAAEGLLSLDGSGSNRRKKRQPTKRRIDQVQPVVLKEIVVPAPPTLPQVCLLCDQQFPTGSSLARHVFDTHGIDMAQVLSSEPIPEVVLQRSLALHLQVANNGLDDSSNLTKSPKSPKSVEKKAEKKKLPELVKITDLKSKRESIDMKHVENDAPPTLTASYVCPLCPASLTNKCDLYAHLRLRHSQHAKLICGLCLHIASSLGTLQEHVDACSKSHPTLGYFICQLCKYSDDNQKTLENHVLVHDFLLGECKKEGKIFDPAEYIDTNLLCEPKSYVCSECPTPLLSFKDFSSHRRAEHSIFHCDLCNKSYGRNSHLWKHVNRVHKGHPSVTCQFCYKTSASKYHLLQHFNKIHTSKSNIGAGAVAKIRNGDVQLLAPSADSDEDFMSKRFEAFDFQSVRQSFMRQELQSQGKDPPAKVQVHSKPVPNVNLLNSSPPLVPPKELDSSSTIYTNIITNYTPPTNDGEFKCPKCSKAFHKRTLLKKHKKNCRPRLQKDLLTRCKSCSRIFKDRQSLAKHLVNYHSEYSCEECAEKVQSKCEIVSHIRFTHPESRLVCAECGNVLRNNDLLRSHLADHNNSFVCQFCGDILPSKIKLKMHILSLHRKILSLSCGVCLKLFENQHILRDHVRLVHKEALQPLTSCTVCGKNYGSKWKTYDHLNKSHGRVFKACKSCLEVFNNEAELQVHFDMMHSKGGKKVASGNGAGDAVPEKEAQILLPSNDVAFEHNPDETQEESSGHDSEVEEKSILEKHLVGAYARQLQQPVSRNNNKINGGHTKSAKMRLPLSQGTTTTTPLTPERAGEQDALALINSSKRTVYVNSNDPSVCDICHKNWPAKKHLWQHYIRCHKDVAATVCGICLCTNDSYESLQAHLNREHPTLLHGKGFGSNFICRICGRYHNASSKLRLHMAIHTKFDWSLLEEQQPQQQLNGPVKVEEDEEDDDDDEEEEEHNEEKLHMDTLKYEDELLEEDDNAEEVVDGEVNYESLIEQVECSTNSSSSSSESEEDDDDEHEEVEREVKQEEDDDDDEMEDEDVKTEVVLKQEEGMVEQEEVVQDADDDDEEEEDDEDDEDFEEVVQEVYEEGVEDSQPDEEEDEVMEMYEETEIVEQEEYIEEVDDEEEEDEEMEEVPNEIVIKHVVGDEEDEENDDVDFDDDDEEHIVDEDEEHIVDDEEEHIIDDDEEQIVEEEDNENEVQVESEDTSNEEDDEEEVELENDVEVSYIEEDDDEEVEEEEDADVVDSAVKSICYDVDSCNRDDSPQEYEVQSHNNLNQHEIQSAVDSIL